MKEKIVQTSLGITIIGAGQCSAAQISKSRDFAPFVVAADGGVKAAIAAGAIPEAVIGDLDSYNPSVGELPKDCVFPIAEQDSTDFEKCLYSIEAPFAIAHGVTGSRLDHSLAAMNALVRHRAFPVVVMSGDDLVFRSPAELRLSLPIGTRLSLFPMHEVQGTSTGLEYPIDGLALSPWARIGTSNCTDAETVSLSFNDPHMLVILPWAHLGQVLKALSPDPDPDLNNKSG